MQKIRLFLSLLVSSSLLFWACGGKSENANKEENTHQTNGSEVAASASLPKSFYKHLEGTINQNLPIVMDLTVLDTAVRGSYYYVSKGQGISIWGSFKNGKLELSEYGGTDGDYTGVFKGSLTNDGTFSGEWSDPKAKKTFPVSLKENYPAGSTKVEMWGDSYNAKIQDGKFKGELNLSMTSPIIKGDNVAKINAAINRAFYDGKTPQATFATLKTWQDTLKRDIKQMEMEDMMYEFDEFTGVIFNEGNILSVENSGSDYMGGAHPNSYDLFGNFDTKTGDTLGLAQILVPNYLKKLTVVGEQNFRKQNKVKGDWNTDGYEFDNGFYLPSNFSIGKGGLTFMYESYEIGPYAMGMPSFFIPYSEIKDLIKPNGHLAAFVK